MATKSKAAAIVERQEVESSARLSELNNTTARAPIPEIPALQLRVSYDPPAGSSLSKEVKNHDQACEDLHQRYLTSQQPRPIDLLRVSIAELEKEYKRMLEARFCCLQDLCSLGTRAEDLLEQMAKEWGDEASRLNAMRDGLVVEVRDGMVAAGFEEDRHNPNRLMNQASGSSKVRKHDANVEACRDKAMNCHSRLRAIRELAPQIKSQLENIVKQVRD